MRPTTLRRLSLLLVLAGAVALAPSQFAFSSVTADRTTQMQVTDDPGAYLGIVDNSPNVGTVGKSSGDVVYLDDNAGGAFDASGISASIVSYANCTSDPGVDCPSVDVAPSTDGHDFEVVVSCDGTDIKATDTMTISLQATGSTVSVDAQRTTSDAVETNCRGNTGGGGGFSSVTAGDVTQDGATQSLSFTLSGSDMKNGGTVTVDLSDATGVDYSGATVTAGGSGSATFVDENTIEFTASGKLKTGTTVQLSVDGYMVTDGSSAPWTAVFTRSDASGYDSDDFGVQ